MPFVNANSAKTTGGRAGSSPQTFVTSDVPTAGKPRPKKPKRRLKTMSIGRDVANPHSKRQEKAEPRQDRVITARIGHLSLRYPRTRRPTIEDALQTDAIRHTVRQHSIR